MPKADEPAAVAALARWLAGVTADEAFLQHRQQRLAERDSDPTTTYRCRNLT